MENNFIGSPYWQKLKASLLITLQLLCTYKQLTVYGFRTRKNIFVTKKNLWDNFTDRKFRECSVKANRPEMFNASKSLIYFLTLLCNPELALSVF